MRNTPRVILVDDNIDAVDMMSELLSYVGIENQVAYNGRSAVELLEEWPAQIVLLDISMPVMNGYETAIAMHALDGYETLPIVAWSADHGGSPSFLVDAARFVCWLRKPVELQQVLEIIDRFTARND